MKLSRRRVIIFILGAIPVLAALWVWLSALSFVPVPWPDDSAFYFVAKSLFHWPPRWVMLPQAPFEPTYRIWNFNTMPLYPILIGLGRFVGIDGSFRLKIWPLSFWAASGSFFAIALYRAGLPALLSALVAAAMAMDPAMRWASVLVRPESLIGLAGIILVTGLCLNWYRDRGGLWDPIAALLALGAYAHFNAVHLVFAVLVFLVLRPKRMLDVVLKTTLYLSPWILTVALKPNLFVHQMRLQWERLSGGNDWLKSVTSAVDGLYQNMGSPEAWPNIIRWAAIGLWILIFAAVIGGALLPAGKFLLRWKREGRPPLAPDEHYSGGVNLFPAAGWVIGAFWIWNEKPEVWFTYYLHISLWCFVGLAALKLSRRAEPATLISKMRRSIPLTALTTMVSAMVVIFVFVNVSQAARLGKTRSWHWDTYHEFVSCIDRTLTEYEASKKHAGPFTVWAPTFPDTTIELSRRHPDWELSRTNDFWSRVNYAIRHGVEADAVVVTETINWPERDIDAPWSQYPQIHSAWMDWKDYFLNRLMVMPGWKPNRHLCQKGRWQAFIFMK